uniref:Uncharacterized protein n=1 Tax=Palpitomonas bilix TaxID=652834 RepID=A0A7S3LVE7_9EUKA|mmetsp:Transcript_49582/g.127590  ORF Transcript_49582/g.127590 Transcript_49582/m.127590 type:complete len:283 (+) Transcript_49582:63-911(+)
MCDRISPLLHDTIIDDAYFLHGVRGDCSLAAERSTDSEGRPNLRFRPSRNSQLECNAPPSCLKNVFAVRVEAAGATAQEMAEAVKQRVKLEDEKRKVQSPLSVPPKALRTPEEPRVRRPSSSPDGAPSALKMRRELFQKEREKANKMGQHQQVRRQKEEEKQAERERARKRREEEEDRRKEEEHRRKIEERSRKKTTESELNAEKRRRQAVEERERAAKARTELEREMAAKAGVEDIPLCPCGASIKSPNVNACAVNCPLYRRPNRLRLLIEDLLFRFSSGN